VGGCLVALAACAPVEVAPPPALPAVPVQAPVLYEWHAEGLYGEPSVVIDLQMQRAEVFIGGQYAGWSVVATGKEGFGTPAGDYTILEKVVKKYSTLYGRIVDAAGKTVKADADVRRDTPPPGGRFSYAPMPYWMRLTWRGIGMHAGPIPRPGSPASHGCIRLPRAFAIQLYQMVRIGTPVRIIR
jgi:lipoprotein-anchoring transpeptidase ErfK/SrfK